MAQHSSVPSLLRESINEYLVVADYCVYYRKDHSIWGSQGCFGYPAALLLLSIADSIGSYVLGGSSEDHFKILNNKDYYNLKLSKDDLELIYKDHRCLLSHNSALSTKVGLSIGENTSNATEQRDGRLYINLLPFLERTKKVVEIFLGDVDDIVSKSKTVNKIIK
jgi:hypothetical protein